MNPRRFLAAVTGSAVTGCPGGWTDGEAAVVGEMLTTTSTYDTGLLEGLNGAYVDRFGAGVDAVAQGPGTALVTARNGESDVVMVDARSLEDESVDGEQLFCPETVSTDPNLQQCVPEGWDADDR
ncbi:hypothetical protein [Halovenus amylolytica]|uniref:hypothetical protein n=1 Tax=Halovenus amylolytica TaxID=2500550 RepID=UPI00361B7E00